MGITRKIIINQLVIDFKDKFSSANGYLDIVNVFRGNIFSEDVVQFPCLSIDFASDIHSDGDYLDDNAVRTLSLIVYGAVNTSSTNFDIYDDLVEYTEEFLRSDNCSYQVELADVLKLENDKVVGTSYFSIQINIRYDRQY